jgi:hypothetical protein
MAKGVLFQIKKSYAKFPEGSVLYFINFLYETLRDTETWITPIPVIAMAIKVIYGDASLVVHHERKRFLSFDKKLQFLMRNSLTKYIDDDKHYYIFEYQNGSVIETTHIFKKKLML